MGRAKVILPRKIVSFQGGIIWLGVLKQRNI